MEEVRSVHRITSESLERIGSLRDRVLIGEEILMRVGRSSFTLSYLPLPKAEWRSFAPIPDAAPEKLVSLENSAVFAAFQGEQFIGIACIRLMSGGWAELMDIRVDAAYRRTGAGRMLLDACIRYAQSRGAMGIRVEVSESNPVLCQFCEHTGFRLHGIDRMALIYTENERNKPMARRASALYFYLLFDQS